MGMLQAPQRRPLKGLHQTPLLELVEAKFGGPCSPLKSAYGCIFAVGAACMRRGLKYVRMSAGGRSTTVSHALS